MTDVFFIFVSFLRGMTAHNLRVTRTFTSAAWSQATFDPEFCSKYLSGTAVYQPFFPGANDLKVISPFCLSVINDYRVEYDAERVRLMSFPLLPSRLSATYAFGDYASCEEVSRRYHWNLNTVRRFRLERDAMTRVHRCNMEIVSLARHAYYASSISGEDGNALWRAYWSGQGNLTIELPDEKLQRRVYQSGELWEYLIEGRIVLLDEESHAP